ncbi:hypothetical protein [Dysgonomonas sp. GY617]|nr:hypothetical protein [Dysgonomonas sp. GY617]MBF0574447.1 hypothetical protein [Dysgonomonas sp. GY617]
MNKCIVVATINIVERTAPVVPAEPAVEICRLPVNYCFGKWSGLLRYAN